MQWDVFCRVVDNHGDLGVCWRLARQLARRGARVRLWIDEPAALDWMAPEGEPGVTCIDWKDEPACLQAALSDVPDVLVEAFGCEPHPVLLARIAEVQQGLRNQPARRWINLEYLSAESYVERVHGLPSPVFSGPGAGLTRHFFYPGFSERTGGLLRESDLFERQANFDRRAWLASHNIDWQGERLVSLFCYEPRALPELVDQLAKAPRATRLLVTAGRAQQALPPGPAQCGRLFIERLPYLSQIDFDHLLWSCDLNFVRGEDSLVRALWAGAPLVWQIYPQDDDAHHAKLAAFLDMIEAPAGWRQLHHAWNGIFQTPLPVLDDDLVAQASRALAAARARLLGQVDLVAQLESFVAGKS